MDDQTTTRAKKPRPPAGDNRARLIAAGYTILSGKGVEAATVKEIARLADVSPGLFHYYFASKDELLLAVMWEAGMRFRDQIAEDLQASITANGDARAADLVTAHALGHKDPAWFRLRYELFALGGYATPSSCPKSASTWRPRGAAWPVGSSAALAWTGRVPTQPPRSCSPALTAWPFSRSPSPTSI